MAHDLEDPNVTVIIGSGAGGGIAAMVLARAGVPVVVLEKGPWWTKRDFSDDEIKFGSRAMIDLDHRTSPRTWKYGPNGESWSGRVLPASQCVGGGTVHYAAMSFRLREEDFRPFEVYGPVPGGNVNDWPFAYSDIEPYYTRVEHLIGVQGLDAGATQTYSNGFTVEGNAAQSPRSRPFPMPPGPGKIDCLRFAAAARDMGFHPYPCPLAVNSVAYSSQILSPALEVEATLRLRPACHQCGLCSGYGCPVDAKNSTLATAIDAVATLPGFELRQNCTARRLVFSETSAGVRITGVEYSTFVRENGEIVRKTETQKAARVIVAADAVETPRLFLLSGLEGYDRSGQLGRNLMTHHLPAALGFFEDFVNSHRGVYTTHVIDDLYVIPTDAVPAAAREQLPPELRNRPLKGGVVAAVGPSAGEPFGVGGVVSLGEMIPWGEAHVPGMQGAFGHQIYLGMVGDDVPQLRNRVTLSAGVEDVHGLPVAAVEQMPHPRDLAVVATAGPILQSILERAGAAVTASVTATPPFYPSQYNHRMGTMRMGTNPATSVVDAGGRYHAAENLYVMDGSVMVSAGGYNPTQTIQAIAWMLSEQLV